MSRRLITFGEFAKRLARSDRTLDRLYNRNMPGLPPIIRLGRGRAVDADHADEFIDSVVRNGRLPGQAPFQPVGAAAMRVEEAKARRRAQSARKERKSRR